MTQVRDGAELEITDEPFMGVELTFSAGGRPVHAIAVFAEVPTEEERAVMETDEPKLRAL